jgi:hypothetical protein
MRSSGAAGPSGWRREANTVLIKSPAIRTATLMRVAAV